MKEGIGRNEPCRCGSGKKYKKCCGANEAVSITYVMENEMDDLQKRLLHFALDYFEDEIYSGFDDYIEHFTIEEEEERQFYEFVYTIWFSLFCVLEDEDTILKKFIASEAGKIKRPRLKQVLQSWIGARTIAGEIIHVDNNLLTVVDGFSTQSFETVVTNTQRSFEKGSCFLGILLPFEQKYVFFPAPFDLPDLPLYQALDYITLKSQAAGYHAPQEFLTDFFMECMKDITELGGLVDIDNIEWQLPVYKEVAKLLKSNLELHGEMPPTIDIGIILWFKFCEKKQKRIKKPNLYAASMHYLLTLFNEMVSPLTQKEIAKLYGVAVGSLSSIYAEIDDEVEEDIRTIIEMSYEDAEQQNPSQMRESNTTTSKGHAQQLVYEAMEALGYQRDKLALEALKLDPENVDAYVILAENAGSDDEAVAFSKKGMEIGENTLGIAFFNDNKGSFWGLLETRPYMRAKAAYADALHQSGYTLDAIREYEQLLELNPNDNQGVRYRLFRAYLEEGKFEDAERLLIQYEEETANGLYNKLLLELYSNDFSAYAVKLLKVAKKANPHVIPYLSGKKRIPMFLPKEYQIGDEREAILYVDDHFQLWNKIEGLQKWLKKH